MPPRRSMGPGLILLVLLLAAGAVYFWIHRRGGWSSLFSQSSTPEEAAATDGGGTAPAATGVSTSAAPTGASAAATNPVPAAAYNPAASAMLGEAQKQVEAGDLAAARRTCFLALEADPHPTVRAAVETLLGEIHVKLVFSPMPMEEKVEYYVQSGDNLDRLARKFGTTIELIRKSNELRGSVIHVGKQLRILKGTFSIVVDKSDNDLLLTMNDRFFKRYRVGTGKFQRTPTGKTKILDRIAQPVWHREDGKRVPYGDPENVLGTHWLSLGIAHYGIHGTWQPETIGRQESAGCIRLVNSDIEELYTLLPVGVDVLIQE